MIVIQEHLLFGSVSPYSDWNSSMLGLAQQWEDKVYSVEKVSNLLSMEILLEPKNITLRVNGPIFL